MVARTGEPNRLERRKARTRAALVKAAQSFLAAGKPNVPILEITQAADVGMGSFYNHFQTREELFQAAVEEALDTHGAALDALCEQLDDPAQVFAQSFRLTGRLHRRNPTLSKAVAPALPRHAGPRRHSNLNPTRACGMFSRRTSEGSG